MRDSWFRKAPGVKSVLLHIAEQRLCGSTNNTAAIIFTKQHGRAYHTLQENVSRVQTTNKLSEGLNT